MNAAWYISKRLRLQEGSSFTPIIIKIGVLAMAVSVCVLLLTSALINGFQYEISQKVFGFWGHIHVTSINSDQALNAVLINRDPSLIRQLDSIDNIDYLAPPNAISAFINPTKQVSTKTKGGVKQINAFINLPGIISSKKDFEGVVLKGVESNYDWDFFNAYLTDGVTPKFNSETYSSETIISKPLAAKLKLHVGDEFLVSFVMDKNEIRKKISVAGIYSTGLEEYDRRFMLCDIKLLQNVLQVPDNMISGYEIKLDHIEDIEQYNDFIYLDLLAADIICESIMSKTPQIFDWLSFQKVNEQVLFIIMFIVAFINMITVLLILILERTTMIGTLKSLGAKDSTIIKVFIFLGGRIAIKGLIYGNILAAVLIFLQHKFHLIQLDEAAYYLSYAPVYLTFFKWLFINLIVFILIVFFLLIPALLILRIDPIKVLKFD